MRVRNLRKFGLDKTCQNRETLLSPLRECGKTLFWAPMAPDLTATGGGFTRYCLCRMRRFSTYRQRSLDFFHTLLPFESVEKGVAKFARWGEMSKMGVERGLNKGEV